MPADRMMDRPVARDMTDGAIAAAPIIIGLFLNGYNSLSGMALAYLLAAASALALVWRRPSLAGRLRRLIAPAGCALAAAGWLLLIQLGVGPAMGAGPAFAPDMFAGHMLGWLAAALMGLCGVAIAGGSGDLSPAIAWLRHGAAVSLAAGMALWAVGIDPGDGEWRLSWYGRFAGLLGNANVSAVLGGVLVILALAALTPHRRPSDRFASFSRIVAGAEGCLAVLILIASASRFLSALSLLAAAAYLLIRFAPWRRAGWLAIALAILLAGALLVIVLVSSDTLLAARWGDVAQEATARGAMWRHYSDLAAHSPLVGYGLGGFPSANAHFLNEPALGEALWRVNSPHNFVLQLLLAGGVPYLLLMLGAFGLALRLPLQTICAGARGGGAIALWVAVGLIAASSLVDISLDVPAMAMLFCLLVGLLAGYGAAVSPDALSPAMDRARHASASGR